MASAASAASAVENGKWELRIQFNGRMRLVGVWCWSTPVLDWCRLVATMAMGEWMDGWMGVSESRHVTQYTNTLVSLGESKTNKNFSSFSDEGNRSPCQSPEHGANWN